MKTTDLNIELLVPNPWNPNKQPDGTFKKLLSSIKVIGLLNPIIVRKKEELYEIIDGQHRTKALKELGFKKAPCIIKECTDEEVKAILFASCIKGKHDSYKSLEIIEEISDKKDAKFLDACNLDRNKLKRLTKYSGIPKSKSTKHLKNEVDCTGVSPVEDYKPILTIPLSQEDYKEVVSKLKSINNNLSIAIKEALK